jgi:DNA-binding GntR family transcriptional regulator
LGQAQAVAEDVEDTVTSPKRPPTAQQFVLAELRRGILERELLPGEPIRQDALAERLGVSRVPLREALKILEGEGQIVYLPRRGYSVAQLSLADLREVYRIREILEEEAVRIAVGKLTNAEVSQLAEIHAEVERASSAGELAEMTAANRRFHFGLFSLCDMPRLVRMIRLLWDSTDAYRSVYYGAPGNRDRVNHEHRQILAALRKRDTERVLRLLADHRSHAIAALAAVIEAEGA